MKKSLLLFLILIFLPSVVFAKDFSISIDLCPSSKKYEKGLFDYLENLGKRLGKPLPIAIAVSGKWIIKHEDELSDIKGRYLNITWVNHSYSHPVKNDFLNDPKIDFKYEVKENIKVMQEHGLIPSKYFRFPGLVHNRQRLNELAKMGYINLDADAWLAKGQPIKDGSIILVHGNGNEAPGVVDKFIAYLKSREKDLMIVPLTAR